MGRHHYHYRNYGRGNRGGYRGRGYYRETNTRVQGGFLSGIADNPLAVSLISAAAAPFLQEISGFIAESISDAIAGKDKEPPQKKIIYVDENGNPVPPPQLTTQQ